MTESTGDGSPSPVDPAHAGAPVPWPEPIEPAPPAPIPPATPIPSASTRGRFLDHGAIVAGWVGVGMASTIAISFLLVIPIEPIYWLFAPLAGLLIGYYANQRSLTPRGARLRILVDALYAGVVTAVTLVLFLLMVKALFFYADSGYPSFNRVDAQGRPTPPYCVSGPGCVYARYLADGRGSQLEAAGVTDVATFTGLYWQQQFATAGLVLVLAVVGSAFGGLVYGVTRPKDA